MSVSGSQGMSAVGGCDGSASFGTVLFDPDGGRNGGAAALRAGCVCDACVCVCGVGGGCVHGRDGVSAVLRSCAVVFDDGVSGAAHAVGAIGCFCVVRQV